MRRRRHGFSGRRGRLVWAWTILLFSLGLPAAVRAQDKPQDKTVGKRDAVNAAERLGKNRRAVVIGINDYADERIPDLKFSEADAKALYDTLLDPGVGGFTAANVALLTGKQASAKNIRKALYDLRRAGEDDLVLVYFSGHGAKQGGESFWVTQDAELNDLGPTALANAELARLLAAVPSRRLVTLLDCCYAADTVLNQKSLVNIDDVARVFTGKGRVTIAGAGGGEEAIESAGLKHSVFTYFLLNGLRGAADENGDGVVTLMETWAYLEDNVQRAAREQRGLQRPTMHLEQGQETDRFLLTLNAAAATEIQTALAKLKELFVADRLTAAQYEEGKRLLSSPAAGPDQERRKIYLDLVNGKLDPKYLANVLAASPGGADSPPERTRLRPPKPEISTMPRVELEIEHGGQPLGKIVLELDIAKAPISSQNFLRYVEDGFYNDTIFHRVLSDFMIQGGGFVNVKEPKSQGLRGPIFNEAKNGLKNARGTIATARTSQPHSATAQFFINVVDNTRLDDPGGEQWGYCVFGKVVEGMDVVDKIKSVQVRMMPDSPDAKPSQPVDPPVLKTARVVSAYDKEKLAAAVKAAENGIKNAPQEAHKKTQETAAQFQANQEKWLQETIQKIEAETNTKISKTDSGLMYVILKKGSGPSPKPTDKVEMHYTGWLLDGTKFESSVARGQPIVLPLNLFIKGLGEGVGMMKVGGKSKLIIPPNLGDGANPPPGGPIPPNAYLVFEVELLGIK